VVPAVMFAMLFVVVRTFGIVASLLTMRSRTGFGLFVSGTLSPTRQTQHGKSEKRQYQSLHESPPFVLNA
jgi:citrate synthase